MPQPPKSKWTPIPCGGVLDQSSSPVKVGGSGLTASLNLVYDREGSWGKRSGSDVAYTEQLTPNTNRKQVSGIRWYRSYPTPLTQTVFAQDNALWTAGDPGSTPTKLLDFDSSTPDRQLSFCSARDPNANDGNGSDVLIITGAHTHTGFATEFITITTFGPNGPGTVGQNPAPTATITLAFQLDSHDFTPRTDPPDGTTDPFQITYAVLPTDTPTTIAQNLVTLINESYPVATNDGGPDAAGAAVPFLGQAYMTDANNSFPVGSASIHLGALFGGAAQNIKYRLYYLSGNNDMGGGGSIVFADHDGPHQPSGSKPYTYTYTSSVWPGGGGLNYGPLKWDGTNPVDGLSYQITQGFTGCFSWHAHVWLWGDQNDPDTLFATDINQPEGFTFMLQEGGYDIGVGDGDPDIQNCAAIGNVLYVFKTASIYAVTGYDFQSGEYAFQIQPTITDYGIPAPNCVAALDNTLVFWSGRKFCRLSVGAYEVEHIGLPIPLLEGLVSKATQPIIQAAAGSFLTQTNLNDTYVAGGSTGFVIESSIALFSYDSQGDGNPDSVLVYDDVATQRMGKYAWTNWTGWQVGAWIEFGRGLNSAGTQLDPPRLLWIVPGHTTGSILINRYGTEATTDSGAPIPWFAQTGWVNCGTPELVKDFHRLFIEVDATNGALVTANVIPAQTNLPNVQKASPATLTFPATVAPNGAEAYNILYATYSRQLVTPALLYIFAEDGASEASFELLTYSLDIVPEESIWS